MANVYLAVTEGNAGVNKLVVLKALRADLASEPEALAMFTDEARLAAQLNHPNVVQTYDVGRHNGRYVMVMEYLEGQPLSRVMKEAQRVGKPIPLPLALRIISAALDGLHYAHELTSYKGQPLELVHRDVSPQNIFVTYEGQVKVLDFGIAKAASSSTHTADGMIKGKFAYMPPEQMTAEAIDRRADIFSVGCTLWAFATGQKLWHGVADVQVMRRVLEGDIPSPRSLNPECDERLSRIIEKCLARKPEGRYATALELQAEVDRLAEELGTPVQQKVIGRFVADLFAESRSEMRRIVETQLANLDSDQTDLPAVGRVDEFSASGPDLKSRATKISRRPKSWLPLGLGALGLVALGVWFVTGRAEAPAPTVATPSEPSAAPSASPTPAPPKQAKIEFRVTPREAKLFLDGEALEPGVVSVELPLGDQLRTLRAEAKGHETESLGFTVKHDTALELVLKETAGRETPGKGKKPIVSKPGAAAAQAPAPASAPAAKPAAPDCSDPFFIDKNGIKRVRPECR